MFIENKIIDSMVELTGEREVDAMTFSLITALAQMLPVTSVFLWQNDNVSHHTIERYGVSRSKDTGELVMERAQTGLDVYERQLVESALTNTVVMRQGQGERHIVPIFEGEVRLGALVMDSHQALSGYLPQVEAMLRLYTNYVGVLLEANRDQLTGLQNRRRFETRFLRMLTANNNAIAVPGSSGGRRRSNGIGVWLATCDVDKFKRINDTYGHVCGDEVLLTLGQIMRSNFRDNDHIYRFGGEEFVVLMRGHEATDAHVALERFRKAVEQHAFPLVGNVTLSVGYTQVRFSDFPPAALERADRALYYSKQNGRNQTHNFEDLVAAGKLEQEQEVETGDIDLF